MDRKQLLARLRQLGYKGKADLTAIKAWLTDEGYDPDRLLAPDGTEVKCDEVWAKAAVLDAPAPVDDSADDADDDGDSDDAPARKRKAADQPKPKRGKGYSDGLGKAFTVQTSGLTMARKRYDAKAARGESVWPDADTAEVAAALIRLGAMGQRHYEQKDNDTSIIGKAMTEMVNTSGGVLVPAEFAAQLIWLSEKYGVARRLANVIPMRGQSIDIPRQTGIVTFAFATDNAALTESNPTTDNVHLEARKAYGYTQLSNELFDDAAVNVADQISEGYAEGAAKIMDSCYVLGDGSGTYGGMVGLASGLTAAASSSAYIDATGSGWSAMVLADFDGALGALENVDAANIAWLCSRQFYHAVMLKLASAAGGVTLAETLMTRGADGSRGADAWFKGYPVYFSQVMPTATAGGAKSVYVGDFKRSTMLGQNRDLRIDSSEHAAFSSDAIAYRGTLRFGVNIHGDGRGSTYGQVVCLTS